MAVKDSNEIATNSNYALGDYSFRIERSSGTSPNYDKIEAICTKGGKNARKSIQVPSSTQISGWYVEANDTTADVYVALKINTGTEKSSSYIKPDVPVGTSCTLVREYQGSGYTHRYVSEISAPALCLLHSGVFVAALTAGTTNEKVAYTRYHYRDGVLIETVTDYINRNTAVIHDNKTAYWNSSTPTGDPALSTGPAIYNQTYGTAADAAWAMIYGNDAGADYKEETKIVGRFAIEIEDAGGVGPGSDWIDPGDYDPDWEPDDPTHTLYVTVTGALSGRHNDPIVDPSYSYIPSDKNTVKDYGCGGDGGHGGGGGAGASTVVVHKFATNQANSKEVTAIARRHGYGSGGGKGGKGGDGCILVYY